MPHVLIDGDHVVEFFVGSFDELAVAQVLPAHIESVFYLS